MPCGKCNFCLQSKRADWSFRLQQEQKVASSAYFLTLTYEDECLPINDCGFPELDKKGYQNFTKRLRKAQASVSDEKLRYYAVGEYGTETERPHYHAIMFNLDQNLTGKLSEIWQNGFVDVGDVTPASIHYVTKYVVNRVRDLEGDRCPPFALMSRKPALGSNYLDTHTKWHRDGKRDYTQVNGVKKKIPRLFRDKIFTQLERERMAAEAIVRSDQEYHDEVKRLHKFNSNPDLYYEERIRHLHEGMIKKINSKNKF